MSKKSSKSVDSAAGESYAPGDIVLAKVKGFPAWPGQVLEDAMAPNNVQRQKPPKGSKTFYLVRFFPAGDYVWALSRDLSHLRPHEIQAQIDSPPKGKKDLLAAYRIAQDPSEWQKERDALAEMDTEDQLASEGETGEGKKRKRKEGESKKDKKSATKKAPKKSSGIVHSEDDAPPPAKKSKSSVAEEEDPGLKQVKDWRHKLQRAFLAKEGGVVASEVTKCKEYFDAMEMFDMHQDWLAESKLGKVLKRIALMVDGQIPGDDEFQFRHKASMLAKAWSTGTSIAGPTPTPTPATTTTTTTTTNGAATKTEEQAVVEEKPKEEVAPAPAVDEAPKEEAVAPAPVAAEEESPVVVAPAEGHVENKVDGVEPAPEPAPVAEEPAPVVEPTEA